ncbi:MAG: CatB-related O-acetyltransferase [Fusobacteriaceae bacterium]
MKRVIIRIFKVLNLFLFKIKNPSIKVSIFSNIHPYFLKNIDKNIKNIVLGNSSISKDVRISEGTKFLGKVNVSGKLEVGRYTSINGPNTSIISSINSVKIGSFCSIASDVRIQEYFHEYRRTTSYYINRHIFKEKPEEDIFSKGDIIIEDDVWIGANVVILSGVKIGRGSIIGAGSIVTKDIPRYSIVGGNPARVIRSRFCEETINELEKSEWWSWSIGKIKENKNFFQKKRI